VLGGRDLQRQEQGTWLGITKHGRLAVLTNFREEGVNQISARSRGAIVNAFLTQPASGCGDTKAFVEQLVEGEGLSGIGGFSLVCGNIGQPLAVISNRTPNADEITWILEQPGETIGLSNSAIADRSWTKVTRGEQLMSSAIERHVATSNAKDFLIEDLFNILSDDTLPRNHGGLKTASLETYVTELRKSIFIPAVGGQGRYDLSAEDLAAAKSNQHVDVHISKPPDGMHGKYGTQKQTIILVDQQGQVDFVERTLYDANGVPTISEKRDRSYEFRTEGWNSL